MRIHINIKITSELCLDTRVFPAIWLGDGRMKWVTVFIEQSYLILKLKKMCFILPLPIEQSNMNQDWFSIFTDAMALRLQNEIHTYRNWKEMASESYWSKKWLWLPKRLAHDTYTMKIVTHTLKREDFMPDKVMYKLKFPNEIWQSVYTDSFVVSDWGCTSVLARFTTGFWAYNTVAADTMKIAKTVYMSIAIPKIIQHNTAVNISSKALANVFKMEFKFLRNRLVTIPMAALFTTMIKTPGCKMAEMLLGWKALVSSPLKPSTTALQTMESRYMKTFCSMMWTSTPLSFNRYSLYTPAKQELNTWTRIRKRWGFR